MKYSLIFLFLIAFNACTFFNTKKQIAQSIQVATIVDITDKHSLLPDAESILPFYGFDSCSDNEASFRLCTITDKHLNSVVHCFLANGTITEKANIRDDIHYREKLVLGFYQQIRDTIASFAINNAKDTSLLHSECFYTIASELQLMSKNTNGKNVLLVYSDIQENSILFNCYRDYTTLKNNPSVIVTLFNKARLLPQGLNNVTVVFAYHPNTRQEDEHYLAMVNVYKKLLEPRGATIIVQANN